MKSIWIEFEEQCGIGFKACNAVNEYKRGNELYAICETCGENPRDCECMNLVAQMTTANPVSVN